MHNVDEILPHMLLNKSPPLAREKENHSYTTKKTLSPVRNERTFEGIVDNPCETIVNLTNHIISPDELDVLGLRYGLATRPKKFETMAVAEDVWSHAGIPVKCIQGR